jgi:hypothetical protein
VTDSVVAVADGPDGRYATLDIHGTVSVWVAPTRLLSRFSVPVAGSQQVPSHRLAIVVTERGLSIVVGSWSGGVAAFDPSGTPLWSRRDIRHVQRLRSVPVGNRDGADIVSVVREKSGGLVLGPTGGTRRRIPGARYLAGWPDGSLLLFDGARVARLAAHGEEKLWQSAVQTIAVLDAVLEDGAALLCLADGRLTRLDPQGAVVWRTQQVPERRILRVRAHPAGSGWLGLAVPAGRPGVPAILRVSPDGQVEPLADVPGSWVDFVDGGRHLVATSGAVETVDLGHRSAR